MSSEESDAASQSHDSDDDDVSQESSENAVQDEEQQAQRVERDMLVLMEISEHMAQVRERMLQKYPQYKDHSGHVAVLLTSAPAASIVATTGASEGRCEGL